MPSGVCGALLCALTGFHVHTCSQSPQPQLTDCFGDKDFSLTFDDGPSPVTTGLMDTLKAVGVPATFFVVGQMVQSR